MRLLATVTFLQLLSSLCLAQTSKELKFIETTEQVVNAFATQDSAALSEYIDTEVGVYQLDRIGVYNDFKHYKTISFSATSYPEVVFRQSKNIQFLPLRYETLPSWNCEQDKWSKTGLFADTTVTDHLLSKICNDRNKYVQDDIPKTTIEYFTTLENKSRRIVLYDNKGLELVFYLTWLGERWVLSIVDSVSSDCST